MSGDWVSGAEVTVGTVGRGAVNSSSAAQAPPTVDAATTTVATSSRRRVEALTVEVSNLGLGRVTGLLDPPDQALLHYRHH